MENKNGADYIEDLDQIENLLTILLHLQEHLETNAVRYPMAIRAYTTVLYGLIPRIHCECPECGEDIQISAGEPCGGIADAYDILADTIEALDLEILFGGEECESIPDADSEGD